MGSEVSKAKKQVLEKYEDVNKDMQAAMFIKKQQILDPWKFLTIEQELNWIQAFKCCEKNNNFTLHVSKDSNHMMPLGNVGLKIDGEFNELSDFCCRLFIRGAREFSGQLKIDGDVITNMDVPYKCHSVIPCCSCPCTEPMALIKNANNSKIIGQLIQPYYICWCRAVEPCPLIEIQVLEVGDDGVPQFPPVYIITGNCCQTSTICLPFMCLGCHIISYSILDGKNPDPKAPPLGLIKNFCRDCPQECFTKADRFGIDFPEKATAKQKLLLINAAIWLDYLQYEFS